MQVAVLTNKFTLANTVGFFGVSAFRALLTRIFGINRNNCNTQKLSFVFDKTAKFCKRPTRKYRPLFAPVPFLATVTDESQIFKSDAALCANSQRNNIFRDAMINVLLKLRTRLEIRF